MAEWDSLLTAKAVCAAALAAGSLALGFLPLKLRCVVRGGMWVSFFNATHNVVKI